MQIHVLDFQDFDQVIDIGEGISVKDILSQITEKYNYNTSNCSVFHFGQKLEPTFHIGQELLKDDNVLVLLNQSIINEKSYPTVDNAYRFQSSRFRNYYFEPKNAKELCPKLDVSKSNNHNQDNFENSFYNNLQTHIDKELAIAPKVENNAQSNFSIVSLGLDQDINSRFLELLNSDQLRAVSRLLQTGHTPRLVLRTFLATGMNEEATLDALNSI